jgi:fructose-bisphosphate aldolase class II
MMVPMNRLLADARTGRYAVGAFNVYNYETIRGVIEAGAESGVPVIVAFGERYLENMGFDEVVSIVRILSERTGVPAAVHLDHCKSEDRILQAIRAGFSSVMYDGSALEFEENAARTRRIVEIAHAVGVSVEAELGAIAMGERSNEEAAEQIYTDPAQAADFVARTGVDSLAVSIGTVHGMYKGEPKIDVGVLKRIHGLLPIPLVLHGGSGTPEAVLKECIANGICKINVNTEISSFVVDQLGLLIKSGKDYHFSQLSLKAVGNVKEVAKKYIRIFKDR